MQFKDTRARLCAALREARPNVIGLPMETVTRFLTQWEIPFFNDH